MLAVTASHEITREWREYERGNTAVLNAYVQPIVQRYFTKLEGALRELGIDCPFTAMQSNGGTTSFGWAKAHPITLIESGPAAGVNGAALIGELCGEPNVIYLDVGGTTVKCSVIEDGRPKVTTEYKLEWSRLNPGYPVRVPVADLWRSAREAVPSHASMPRARSGSGRRAPAPTQGPPATASAAPSRR